MVKIDKEKCTGCGVCVNICPEGFLIKNSIAEIIDEHASCIDKAANACPAVAIITTKTDKKSTQPRTKKEVFSGSAERTENSFSNYGRGGGQGRNQGLGFGSGGGRGRNQGLGLGQGGYCVCPNCGYKEPHQRGIPCYKTLCPKCNSVMKRV
ncbi:MAG: ferredoxin [Candidatus Celaenobacter antarcticus]|nr:ferredoxin [Candidatus Celaenobacter antarcticus]